MFQFCGYFGGNFALFAIFKLKLMKINGFRIFEFCFSIKYSKNCFAWENDFCEKYTQKVLTSAKNLDFAQILRAKANI